MSLNTIYYRRNFSIKSHSMETCMDGHEYEKLQTIFFNIINCFGYITDWFPCETE